jgi:glycosyltransferase involved in cell wall biosynthesis
VARPVSIIIPAFNQLEYCRQCIDSILANTPGNYQLILVDNGSTDGVGEFFDAVPCAEVIHAGSNRGFAGGVNLGLARAEGHVVVLNSDTLTPEGWLERLEQALQRANDTGIVGPMSNYVSGEQQIDRLSFQSLDQINAFARDLAARNQGKVRDVTRLVGFCMLIRDRVVRELGPFDESYGIGNFEDDDYCLRAMAAGYRLCIAEGAFVFHYGSRTFLGMGITDEKWRALIADNEQRFRRKWNLVPPDRCQVAQRSKQLNEAARRAAESGNLTEALRLYKEAMEVFPLLETNYNDLGAILWQMGQREPAFEYFVRAVRLNPAYTEARDNLREAGQALGKTADVELLLKSEA